MVATWRVIGLVLLLWLAVLIYISTTGFFPNESSARTESHLTRALTEIEQLKKQNKQLQLLATDIKDIKILANEGVQPVNHRLKLEIIKLSASVEKYKTRLAVAEKTSIKESKPQVAINNDNHAQKDTQPPSIEFEKTRRKINNGVKELWFFLRSQLKKLKDANPGNNRVTGKLDEILQDAVEQKRSIMTDLWNLTRMNGLEEWRVKENQQLADVVQKRLEFLQNPKDCSKAKKLVCNLNKGCGYGCQIHHLIYCFNVAIGLQRTFIIQSKGWRYSPEGWEKVYKPISDTCVDESGSSFSAWGPMNSIKDKQVIRLPIVDSLSPRPPFMPLAIPEDLAPRLIRLHGNPIVWWLGQLTKYLLRPQPTLEDDLKESMKKLNFQSPIVGVQVRRTDKIGPEAAFHSIDEYMTHVDDYFKLLERRQPVAKRRIYLASDDPTVLPEAKQKYPQYDIISDNDISKSAGLDSRYSYTSLRGVIFDIHFLSRCDYLVCTFSSQVCRMAYEEMQTRHPDASDRFYSLDDIYYFGGQNAHNQRVLYTHIPRHPGEIDLQVGDLIGIAGNHWDGYSKGMNRRTGQTGLYPSYKVEEIIETAPFPTYKEAGSK